MYNFDPNTGNVVVDPKGISKVSSLYPSNITVVAGDVSAIAQKDNIVPRIGIAYAFDNKSVLRAGYGIFTARLDSAGALNNFLPISPQLGSTGPFSISEVYFNVTSPGTTPLLQFPNPLSVEHGQCDGTKPKCAMDTRLMSIMAGCSSTV